MKAETSLMEPTEQSGPGMPPPPAGDPPSGSGQDRLRELDLWLNWVDFRLGISLSRALLPCLFAAAVACGIVVVEKVFAGRRMQAYLVFNLFLAWVPLAWAWVCYRLHREDRCRTAAFWGCAAGWLLFLPNAPYLFTDLVHLLGKSLPYYWPDMMKVLLFALSGFFAGMLSLQWMHEIVEQRRGFWAGWGFVAVVSVLCSIGVALGRFRRWNSWDALHDPASIFRDALALARHPAVSNSTAWFVLVTSLLLFCGYSMLWGMRRTGRPHVGDVVRGR